MRNNRLVLPFGMVCYNAHSAKVQHKDEHDILPVPIPYHSYHPTTPSPAHPAPQGLAHTILSPTDDGLGKVSLAAPGSTETETHVQRGHAAHLQQLDESSRYVMGSATVLLGILGRQIRWMVADGLLVTAGECRRDGCQRCRRL